MLISLVAFASHEYSNSPFTRCPFTHSHSAHSSYRYYSSSIINLASQRHQHLSWARVTKSKPKRERGRLLATASTRNSQVLALLEMFPQQYLFKILMKHFAITLNGATTSNNCVSSRNSSATAACQASIPPTPSSANGFRLSAPPTGWTKTGIQVP